MAENNIELKERNSPITTTQITVNPKQLKQPVDSMMGKSRITAEQFNTLQNSRIFKKKYQDKWFNGENPAFVKQADGSYLANDYRVKDPNKKGEAVYSKDFKKQIFNPYKNLIAWNKLKEDSWSAAAKNFGFDYTPPSLSKLLFKPKEKTEAETKEWNQIRDELLKRGTKLTEIPTDLNEALEMLNNLNENTTPNTEGKTDVQQESNVEELIARNNIQLPEEFDINQLNNSYLIDIPQPYQFLTQPNKKISDNNKTVTTNNTILVKKGNKINYLNYY